MIQRIQTIYLLLVCLLMGGAVISPLMSFTGADNTLLNLNSCGVYTTECESVYSTVILSVIGIVSSVLALVAIFMYKKRKNQIKLVNANSLLIALFYTVLAVYFYLAQGQGYKIGSLEYGITFPFIAFVFNILAVSKIRSDEKLVRSLDRIR